jgi:outer membrane protein assembly factor BamB
MVTTATTDKAGRFRASFRISSGQLADMYPVLATGGVSGRSATATFDVRTDWPRFRFDVGDSGKDPSESVLGVTNIASLRYRWKFQTGGLIRSSPVVFGHVAYFGSDDGSVYAVDAVVGTQRWAFQTGAAVQSVPDVANGVVYVGSEDGSVYALDARTGKELWSYATGGGVDSSPLVTGGIVYVGSDDGILYALNASDGTIVWTFRTGGRITSAPGSLGANVYVSSWDFNVYELDAATGRLVHTYGTTDAVETSPALANCNGIDWLIFGSHDHNVYAYNTKDFTLEWTYVTAGDVYSSVAISCSEKDGIVLIGTHNWNMESHNLLNGSLNWLYGGPQCLSIVSSPAVADGVVYYGCRSGWVYALDTSVRAAKAGAKADAQPLRLPVWSYQTGGSILSSAAVSDGRLYIGSDDGNVYMFGL